MNSDLQTDMIPFVVGSKINPSMEIIVKTEPRRSWHDALCFSLMSLTELAPLTCSAWMSEGWNPNKLAVTARNAALKTLSH